MKKEFTILLTGLLLALGLGLWANKPNTPTTNPNLGGRGSVLPRLLNTSATTTTTNLTPLGATSTLALSTEDASAIDLNLIAMASTSSGTLLYTVEFSNSVNCPSGASVDWFPEDGFTNTSNTLVTHGAGPRTHTWSLATSTNAVASDYARKNFSIPTVASICTRLNFSAVTASTSLWAEAALSEEIR